MFKIKYMSFLPDAQRSATWYRVGYTTNYANAAIMTIGRGYNSSWPNAWMLGFVNSYSKTKFSSITYSIKGYNNDQPSAIRHMYKDSNRLYIDIQINATTGLQPGKTSIVKFAVILFVDAVRDDNAYVTTLSDIVLFNSNEAYIVDNAPAGETQYGSFTLPTSD